MVSLLASMVLLSQSYMTNYDGSLILNIVKRAAYVYDITTAEQRHVISNIERAEADMHETGTYYVQVAKKESFWNPKAYEPNTGAMGLYQFLASTWVPLIRQYGDRYDLIYNNVYDPYKSTIGCIILTRENKVNLTRALGRIPTNKELYLAHFAGAGGARKLLRADPQDSVEDILGSRAVKYNPFLQGLNVEQAIKVITRGIENDVGS